jgi:glycosyltransferase involved in cell wall biosynthesis
LIIQLYYTCLIHFKLRAYKHAGPTQAIINPVSVIICARNEAKNLTKNLAAILEQEYSDFEVVVVNDCSNDESELVLRDFSQKYNHLKVVAIAEHARFKHGKKFAATLGIKAAKNEHLLFTDADCKPASANWLNLMQRNFSDQTDIILGYSPYIRLKSFVNLLIRYETFFTALNYLSFSLAGNPYMGVGRNLAYKKSLFFKGKGFASHMHIQSGDDDLFVNQNATPTNTVIEIHPDTYVWSDPKTTFSSYLQQKLRHIGAGGVYKSDDKTRLTVQGGSAILFYICIIALAFMQAQWWLLGIIFLLRLGVQLFVYWRIFKRLAYADLVWWLPVLDITFNFFILALNFISIFKKKVQWR